MTFSLLHVAGIVAVIQSFMLSSTLFRRYKNDSSSSKIIALILIIYGMLIISSIIGSAKILWTFIIFSVLGNQIIFLVGPLFYFYIKSLYVKNFSITKKNLFHFILFFIAVIASFLSVKYYSLDFYYNTAMFYPDLAACVQMVVYFIITINILKRNGKFQDIFFQPIYSKLTLPRLLYTGYISLWFFKVAAFIGWDLMKSLGACKDTATLLYLITFLFVNTIVFIGLNRSKLFSAAGKYESSTLCETEKKQIFQRILLYMKNDQPYLDADVSLVTFSKALNIQPGYISQVINEMFNQNFRDVINSYRIEKAKYLILTGSKINNTILSIAYEVGFNSKSTFNAAFKKHTGFTPKEFKNQNKVLQ
jgi:AraC-like DNA-binding protein